MADKPKRGTFIHGIAASEHLDSSGERIKIEGVDVTSLTKDGTFNYEHDSKSPSSIVGKIWEAKKILKRSDCDNESQKYFWDKIKMPFIYVAGELFDSVGHTSAGEVAAMLRYDQLDAMNKDAKKLINFSIEGSRVEKSGAIITKCIARKVSITLTPCNKVCEAEELKIDDNAKKESASGEFTFIQDVMSKADEASCEIMKGEIPFIYQNVEKVEKAPTMEMKRYASHKSKKPKGAKEVYPDHSQGGKTVPTKKRLGKYDSNMRKTITASCGMGSPSAKVQGDAMAKNDFLYKNEAAPKMPAAPAQPASAAQPAAAAPAANSQGSKIGTTQSGKSIFSAAKIADYKGFSPQDHAEAADFHRQMILKVPSFKDKEMHMNKMRLHQGAFSTARNAQINTENKSKTPGAIPRDRAMANVAAAKNPAMPAAPGAMPNTSPKGTMGFSASATNYGKAAPPMAMSNPAASSNPPMPKAAAPAMPANPNMKLMKKSEGFMLIRKLGDADVNKSKNVREQRKKVFGTKSQPGANSAMREKHMKHIQNFVSQFLGLDLKPSGGKMDMKTGQRRDENPEVGVDKPDWRSGNFESQWNPEAAVHEIAHVMLLPKGVGLEEGQSWMDQNFKDSNKKYGWQQGKNTAHEVQPMAAEQLIRRVMGLPASQVSVPVAGKDAPPRMAVDNPGEVIGNRIQQGQTRTGEPKWVDLIRQSKFLHPEHKQRLEDIFSGKLKFHPDKGWSQQGKTLDAAITNRQPGAVVARQAKKQTAAPQELPPNVVRMRQPAPTPAPTPEAAPMEQPPMKIAKSEQRQIMKALGDKAFDSFEKKEELLAFLAERLPNVSEKERRALAKAVAYTNQKKNSK